MNTIIPPFPRESAMQKIRMAYGNENGKAATNGLMKRWFASINDIPISEDERKIHWPLGRRLYDHSNLTDLGL
ncbi:DUF1348 family protein [Paenibacillus massiliensis]|uniref:DUF1348 family protein n=1 Tax=Paenibacillus massiliensis TaxID=225917 RepID=UPI000404B98D|nr:DUF1348 family protein [Paenibacillus massiliensis]